MKKTLNARSTCWVVLLAQGTQVSTDVFLHEKKKRSITNLKPKIQIITKTIPIFHECTHVTFQPDKIFYGFASTYIVCKHV